MSKIEITNKRGKLVVDSRLIAQALGIQHKNFLTNIEKYEEEAVSEGFLPLAFETRMVKLPQGGSYEERWAWLDEEWANYAMTLSRNTPEVRAAKRGLVKAFCNARKELTKQSSNTVLFGNTSQRSPEHSPSSDSKEEIEKIIEEWLEFVFKISRVAQRCFASIQEKSAEEKIRILNEIDKGIDKKQLEYLAVDAIDKIIHRVDHQPDNVKEVIREQVEPYRDKFAQMLVKQLVEMQGVFQPALPPTLEEFPIQKTSSERRRAVIAFIFDLIDEYGSLDAIPRRGKGRSSVNLEVDWGSAKLSKKFGVSANTILNIWDEVDEAIKQYGETGAWQRLL